MCQLKQLRKSRDSAPLDRGVRNPQNVLRGYDRRAVLSKGVKEGTRSVMIDLEVVILPRGEKRAVRRSASRQFDGVRTFADDGLITRVVVLIVPLIEN